MRSGPKGTAVPDGPIRESLCRPRGASSSPTRKAAVSLWSTVRAARRSPVRHFWRCTASVPLCWTTPRFSGSLTRARSSSPGTSPATADLITSRSSAWPRRTIDRSRRRGAWWRCRRRARSLPNCTCPLVTAPNRRAIGAPPQSQSTRRTDRYGWPTGTGPRWSTSSVPTDSCSRLLTAPRAASLQGPSRRPGP